MSTTPVTGRSPGGAGGGPSALNRLEDYGGARLLLSDIRVASLLLNEARCAVVARLFGVPRDKSVLVTIIAVGALAQAAHDKATRALGIQAYPSFGDSMIGTSVLRESAHWITGDYYRDTPIFGTLIAIGVLGTSLRPVLRVSLRGAKAASHGARVEFENRYGHLLRPRRYAVEDRAQETSDP
jgi:hypothetical protein